MRMWFIENKMRYFFIAIVSIAFASCSPKEQVDLILHNGTFHSLNANNDTYEAVAIRDGKIVAVGPENEILNGYKSTSIYDMEKKHVYPGFIDAHAHLLGYSLMKNDLDLVGTTSWNEIVEKCKNFPIKRASGWLVGRGWDQNDWATQSEGNVRIDGIPTNESLNTLFPQTPVVLIRIDGHAAIANDEAMKRAGVMVADGVLLDNDMTAVLNAIPKHSKKEKAELLVEGQQDCIAAGLTTIDEAGIDTDDLKIIDSLQKSGSFHLRVYAMLNASDKDFQYWMERGPDTSSSMLKIRSVKFMADGALGSRGACLKQAYADVLTTKGALLNDPGYFRFRFAAAYSRGFQVCTHAIGDSANAVVLKWYGELLEGVNDKRWRIEHAQVIDSADFAMFQQYSVIPSVQPTHAISDAPWAMSRLGGARLRYAYNYKRLLNYSNMLSLGTDFPVEIMDPLRTFYTAVFRKEYKEGSEVFAANESLTPLQALYGMTVWAAVSNFEEAEKGSIEVGKLADFTVLNLDILKVTDKEMLRAKVDQTILNGVVFRGGKRLS
jgi:predicted amidohydrolase YtcJ